MIRNEDYYEYCLERRIRNLEHGYKASDACGKKRPAHHKMAQL